MGTNRPVIRNDPFLEYLAKPCSENYASFLTSYFESVSRLVSRMISRRDAVEDVVQETFVSLIGTRRDPGEITKPRSYVLRVAVNAAQRYLRDEHKRKLREIDAGIKKSRLQHSVEEEVLDGDEILRLHKAVEDLPKELRIAIHLRAFEGLSYREIAQITGVSVGSVGMRIRRAREQLREVLGRGTYSLVLLKLGPYVGAERWAIALPKIPVPVPQRVLKDLIGAKSSSLPLLCFAGISFLALAIFTTFAISLKSMPSPTMSSSDNFIVPKSKKVADLGLIKYQKRVKKRSLNLAPSVQPSLTNSQLTDLSVTDQDFQFTKTERDEAMKESTLLASLLLLQLTAPPLFSAEELGDFDGDGFVTFADAFFLREWLEASDIVREPATGSVDFTPRIRCSSEDARSLSSLVFMEALRRVVPDPMPHFIEEWPELKDTPSIPPRVAGGAHIEILPSMHLGSNRDIEFEVRVIHAEPIQFLGFVLEVEGLDVRPPLKRKVPEVESLLRTLPEYYLLSRGLLAGHSRGLRSGRLPLSIDASEGVQFKLSGILPVGTRSGKYRMRLIAPELVTVSGQVLRPAGEGSNLELFQTIEGGGSGLPFPPLEFGKPDERRIKGSVAFRVLVEDGFPGDQVKGRVQVRTERPINNVDLELTFDHRALRIDSIQPLYSDPKSGAIIDEDHEFQFISGPVAPDLDSSGRLHYRYLPWTHPERPESVSPAVRWTLMRFSPFSLPIISPSLEYLAPLNEWLDLIEIHATLLPSAAGRGETFLKFRQSDGKAANFHPYSSATSIRISELCHDSGSWWTYDPIEWQSGTITVQGEGDPPSNFPPIDPLEAEIRFQIGRAEGKSGGIVKVPLEVESAVQLWKLRMPLAFDQAVVEFMGFDFHFKDADGESYTKFLSADIEHSHGTFLMISNSRCGSEPDSPCRAGIFPNFGFLHQSTEGVPEGRVIIDVQTLRFTFWLPETVNWVGDAVFRIREDAKPGLTPISASQTEWSPSLAHLPIQSEFSGFPPFTDVWQERFDVPAIEVEDGVITITSPEESFRRGDVDGNGVLDLSDPLASLSYQFLGQFEPNCLEALDWSNDGSIDLSDPIASLTHQFLGGETPVAPGLDCGLDPDEEVGLGCEGPTSCTQG